MTIHHHNNNTTTYAKYAIAVLYVFVLIAIRSPKRMVLLHLNPPAIAFCGATVMMFLQLLLQFLPHHHNDNSNDAPPPSLHVLLLILIQRVMVNFLGPMVVLFGNILIATCWHRAGVWTKLGRLVIMDHHYSIKYNKYTNVVKIMATSFVCSALWMDVTAVTFLSMAVLDPLGSDDAVEVPTTIPFVLALTSGATLGSALTMTGSIHTMILTMVSYDTIDWKDYSRDALLPVLASIGVHGCILAIMCHSKLSSTNTDTTTTTKPTADSELELSMMEHQGEEEDHDDEMERRTNHNVYMRGTPGVSHLEVVVVPEEQPLTIGVGVFLSICFISSIIAGWHFYAMLFALLALLALTFITNIKRRSATGTVSITCTLYFLCWIVVLRTFGMMIQQRMLKSKGKSLFTKCLLLLRKQKS
jgi:Na+/H+ antiporter NhaD/arsenite permease-like protein